MSASNTNWPKERVLAKRSVRAGSARRTFHARATARIPRIQRLVERHRFWVNVGAPECAEHTRHATRIPRLKRTVERVGLGECACNAARARQLSQQRALALSA